MIHKFLDLSTAHLTEGDVEALDNAVPDELPLRICSHEYGWILFVPEHQVQNPRELFSDTLMAIIRRAQQDKCMLVCFDEAAPELENFQTFKWEGSVP